MLLLDSLRSDPRPLGLTVPGLMQSAMMQLGSPWQQGLMQPLAFSPKDVASWPALAPSVRPWLIQPQPVRRRSLGGHPECEKWSLDRRPSASVATRYPRSRGAAISDRSERLKLPQSAPRPFQPPQLLVGIVSTSAGAAPMADKTPIARTSYPSPRAPPLQHRQRRYSWRQHGCGQCAPPNHQHV